MCSWKIIGLLFIVISPLSLFAESAFHFLPSTPTRNSVQPDSCSIAPEQFSSIISTCPEVLNNEICLDIKPEFRRKCGETSGFASASLKRLYGTAIGFGHSVAETAKSISDIMIWYANYLIPIDGRNRGKEFADAVSKFNKEQVGALVNAVDKSYDKNDQSITRTAQDLSKTLGVKFQEFVDHELVELNCLNHEEQNKRMSKLLTDLLFPPAGLIAVLKYGKDAKKMETALAKIVDDTKLALNKELSSGGRSKIRLADAGKGNNEFLKSYAFASDIDRLAVESAIADARKAGYSEAEIQAAFDKSMNSMTCSVP